MCIRDRNSLELGKEVVDVSDAALRLLDSYEWPGNIRELENAVERAIVIARGRVLEEEDFSFLRRKAEERAGWSAPPDMTLKEVEQRVVETALERCGGNVKAAAEALGIDRSTLYDKIKRFGIQRPGS